MTGNAKVIRKQKNDEIKKLKSELSAARKQIGELQARATAASVTGQVITGLVDAGASAIVAQKDELIAEKTKQVSDMGNEIVKQRLEIEELRAKHECPKCHKVLSHERCECELKF